MSALHRLRTYLTRRNPVQQVRVGWAVGNHDWGPGRSRVGVGVTREALRKLDRLADKEPDHDDE